MLRGDLGAVAGRGAAPAAPRRSRAIGLEVGRPVQPMLAAPATDVADALAPRAPGRGRGQARRRARAGPPRRAATSRCSPAASTTSPPACPRSSRRRSRCPPAPWCSTARRSRCAADGRPQPFQVTGGAAREPRGGRPAPHDPAHGALLRRRCTPTARTCSTGRAPSASPRSPRWCRRPGAYRARWPRTRRRRPPRSRRRSHAGTRASWSKSLDAPYEAGRRGAGWLKVKPRHTLDLVVLAAEWGHGRRRGWLSATSTSGPAGARRPTPAS